MLTHGVVFAVAVAVADAAFVFLVVQFRRFICTQIDNQIDQKFVNNGYQHQSQI